MAKFALLIGVSEYEFGLEKLPAAVKDVEAMQRVLLNPEMGGFAENEIIVLENPQRQDMENAIERLFANRKRDNLLLFYFSGHGITDDSGKLYLTNSKTQKTENGNLVKTSATAASLIHEFMERSRSQRQVIILDSCFSGAFAEGMKAKDDGTIDIKQQLGGKGRAVLTSSASTEYSFEQKEKELSIYTHYIVEGIETGAADTDDNGIISVDELHEYAVKKVQEEAPAMNPKIFAVEEGFKINLAKAPVGDPTLQYRKQVERYLRNGKISRINRRSLKIHQSRLNLSHSEAKQIEHEVFEPIRKYQANLQEYKEAIQEALEEERNLSQETWNDLKELQQLLNLRDEDVKPIHEKLISPANNLPKIPPTPKIPPNPPQTDDLSSEKGIDYTRLRDLLAAGKWKEADVETYEVMIKAVGKKSGEWFTRDELLNFPCQNLRTIDQLWVKYSDGQFGFSVQKEIYLSVGGKPDGKYYEKAWLSFAKEVGWKKGEEWITQVTFDTKAPRGHLPTIFYRKAPRGHLPTRDRWDCGILFLSHRDL